MRLNVPLQFLFSLFIGTASILGANLPFRVNVNATVIVTPTEGSMQEFSVTGGTDETLNITWTDEGWQNTDQICTFNIVPSSDRYQDTTFSQSVSTNWNDAVSISLSEAPLPEDTAFIPIRTNVPATLTATPLSMISGSTPSGSFTFQLAGRKNDTIVLPVINGGTGISSGINNSVQSISSFFHGNTHMLTLPASYQNGNVKIFTVAGRVVGSKDLSSSVQNDMTVWNVGTGIYMMQVVSPSGVQSVQKIQHKGGDLRLSASFSADFITGGILNSSKTSFSPRAATAKYRFEIVADDSKYESQTAELDFSGQMNASKSFYLIDPNATGSQFDQLLDSMTYEELFPNRFGLGYGAYINDVLPDDPTKIAKLGSDGDYDFFTYNSLLSAIEKLSEIEVELYVALDRNGKVQHGCSRLVWLNKTSGVSKEFKTQATYDEAVSNGSEQFVGTIDYSTFCNEGDASVKKQELAAFFGNISHETTGGGNEEKRKTWGLYWREEAAWQNGGGGLGYVDQYPNALYPPSGGQSYHGRGPIQITHNVNYGQLSEFLYGDKQVLLDNPGLLVPENPEDATVAFMSAIWFWMTPQAPKPSCHDVMVGNWIPDEADKAANRDKSKFGMTVNIINGGLECGRPTDHRVEDRIGFYKRYIQLLGETPESDCECSSMGYY